MGIDHIDRKKTPHRLPACQTLSKIEVARFGTSDWRQQRIYTKRHVTFHCHNFLKLLLPGFPLLCQVYARPIHEFFGN
jgi:hypothetical protein